MKCVICHGEEIELRTVNEEFERKTDIVRVPVRVLVCNTCGERYYDRKAKRYLEEIEARLAKPGMRLRAVGKVKVLAA